MLIVIIVRVSFNLNYSRATTLRGVHVRVVTSNFRRFIKLIPRYVGSDIPPLSI